MAVQALCDCEVVPERSTSAHAVTMGTHTLVSSVHVCCEHAAPLAWSPSKHTNAPAEPTHVEALARRHGVSVENDAVLPPFLPLGRGGEPLLPAVERAWGAPGGGGSGAGGADFPDEAARRPW